MKSSFDYESKPFGLGKITTAPWFIPALKLKYGLASIEGVRGKILEIGCGGGAMAKAIKRYRPDLQVYGGDISRSTLALAKQNSNGVKFEYADIYKLPYTKEEFGAILGFDVFEHFADLKKAISESKRVLKKGGIIHIAIPYEGSRWNIEGWLTLFGWRAKEIYCGHVKGLRIGQVEKEFERNGFRLIDRRFSTHLLGQLADALYFSLIYIRGKNFPYQVEGYVSQEKGAKPQIVKVLKNIFATVTYFESLAFFWFPGLTGHLTFKKIT
ncbi:MAG: hypothetical protein A3C27_02505 [Candidatus Levybacteria bacterium RIFCSPHIGHO2_02_FULL_39_36]|nr:MAG: hypothetical protein UT20_C0027G0010 [Candidatus Levybacteria bacterium GW2011_GWA1_39_11]KKR25785.1 MAG: hypothetical protein UT57_C0055G0010 [Microgenomates group bacterium GW2011_GWC1_39_7]OGH28549.1 MAG: hypothetical protein A3C27_02505 [Candidatus Levybacteria bacterium RIFCSPHIGHO2_02_FULL_39_36]OGH45603.1 MAG: hypothetical protein A3H82_00185 [Candidatus Levybacteria bacterium RIFCSPLOWO2_02_FULL_39_26]OGH47610.1 MAG: hypothetical protein A3G66_01275 [Candidatus Levybacteria bact